MYALQPDPDAARRRRRNQKKKAKAKASKASSGTSFVAGLLFSVQCDVALSRAEKLTGSCRSVVRNNELHHPQWLDARFLYAVVVYQAGRTQLPSPIANHSAMTMREPLSMNNCCLLIR